MDDEDPLGLRELGVRYDYLMYKIGDRMNQLAEETYTAVMAREEAINGYLDEQLDVKLQIADSERLIGECEKLELEFMKLDQLEQFILGFKERLNVLEREFK